GVDEHDAEKLRVGQDAAEVLESSERMLGVGEGVAAQARVDAHQDRDDLEHEQDKGGRSDQRQREPAALALEGAERRTSTQDTSHALLSALRSRPPPSPGQRVMIAVSFWPPSESVLPMSSRLPMRALEQMSENVAWISGHCLK